MRKKPTPKGFHWDQKEPYIHPDNGKPSCRWCRGMVPKGRHSWCGSPECIKEWTFRTTHSVFLAVIYDRDHGVCAQCNLDTNDFNLKRLSYQRYAAERIERENDPKEGWRKWKPRVETVVVKGVQYPRPASYWHALYDAAIVWRAQHKIPMDEPPWQCDHRVPVVDNGDWYCKQNLMSLCVPCHRAKTSRENSERARLRRIAKKGTP